MKEDSTSCRPCTDELQETAATSCSDRGGEGIAPFATTLADHGLAPLHATGIDILQVNTGYRCNLRCTHCHVDARPDRTEMMSRDTMAQCIEVLKSNPVRTLDITGGAPEMNPDFRWFLQEARAARPDLEILVRSNLTLLVRPETYADIPDLLRELRVNLIASLPCYTKDNVDRQRGNDVFERSIEALRMLNGIGYGVEGSPLELNLVYNPGGPYLPGCQHQLEADYRKQLMEQFGISFTRLYTITNMPVSRFLQSLVDSGQYCTYMELLATSFNPAAVGALMCLNTISVRWDGKLYDCDFNQMLDIPVDTSAPQTIGEFDRARLVGRRISIGQHCYGCTAGAGSSCQGSLL
ncbi:MAG: radical SAM/Cys-rich domain protein [Chlorobiaceae bacterium]|nr:radical SAM/Cys-rich domain protein [Chlorobiaceae bacterium]NTV25177.1 radical SAM/Cys-rich domain protein [Chlorobiaceae bacterium]